MSSYGKDEFMGGLWEEQGDRNKLIDILAGSYPSKNKSAWGKVFDVIYPMYSQGVKDGKLPVYGAFTPTATTVEKSLADKSGYNTTDIHNFMITLHSAAKNQQVPMVMLNPGVPGVVRDNALIEGVKGVASGAKEGFKEIGGIAGAGVGELFKGAWPLVIGVVAVAAIAYAPAFVGIKKSIGAGVRKVKATFSR